MKLAVIIALAVVTSALPAQAQQPLSLDLSCPGSGDAQEMVRNHAKRDKDDPGYVSRRRPVTGTARVRIRGDMGEVLLPQAYVVDGEWRQIKKMVVSDDAIRGKVQVALLASGTLAIDRRTGILTLTTGMNGFTGQCTAVDLSKRAF